MTAPLGYAQYQESARALEACLGDFRPQVLLILGSGLGFLGDEVERPIAVPYGEVPHMNCSTAPDHKGQFVFGRLSGCGVAVMQGRLHTYEGRTMEEAAYPVRLLRMLGAETLVVTNAAGAVNTAFAPGDIMLITDHIKLFAGSPLTGPNIDAVELGLPLRQGVYMFFPGPQFETPAEVRAARLLGADAVGMSTVPEAIAAAHCGMKVLGFTLCTNMAAGVLEQPLSGEEVIAAGAAAALKFSALVRSCLEKV